MSTAKFGDTVRIHYVGTLDDGAEFDTTLGRGTRWFTIGEGKLIAGFEQAVIGMAAGEDKTVTIPAEEAYGEHHEDMVQEVPRSQVPDGTALQIGTRLQAEPGGPNTTTMTVVALSDTTVTFDANHPLAGEDLTFAISLVDIA